MLISPHNCNCLETIFLWGTLHLLLLLLRKFSIPDNSFFMLFVRHWLTLLQLRNAWYAGRKPSNFGTEIFGIQVPEIHCVLWCYGVRVYMDRCVLLWVCVISRNRWISHQLTLGEIVVTSLSLHPLLSSFISGHPISSISLSWMYGFVCMENCFICCFISDSCILHAPLLISLISPSLYIQFSRVTCVVYGLCLFPSSLS